MSSSSASVGSSWQYSLCVLAVSSNRQYLTVQSTIQLSAIQFATLPRCTVFRERRYDHHGRCCKFLSYLASSAFAAVLDQLTDCNDLSTHWYPHSVPPVRDESLITSNHHLLPATPVVYLAHIVCPVLGTEDRGDIDRLQPRICVRKSFSIHLPATQKLTFCLYLGY